MPTLCTSLLYHVFSHAQTSILSLSISNISFSYLFLLRITLISLQIVPSIWSVTWSFLRFHLLVFMLLHALPFLFLGPPPHIPSSSFAFPVSCAPCCHIFSSSSYPLDFICSSWPLLVNHLPMIRFECACVCERDHKI